MNMPWQINPGEVFHAHRDAIYTLEKGLTPEVFYSAGADGWIIEWNIFNSEKAIIIAKTDQPIYALCLIPENNLLIIGQKNGGIHFLDIISRKLIASRQLNTSSIYCIQYLGDQKVFIGAGDGSISIWDINQFNCTWQLGITSESIRSIAINKTQQIIAVGSSDKTIRIYSIPHLQLTGQISTPTGSVFALTFTPDGNSLWSSGRDAVIRIREIINQVPAETEHVIPAHLYTVHDLCCHPQLPIIASSSMDKTIKIWHIPTFELLKVIDKPKYAAHQSSVNKLQWLQDGDSLISCSDDRQILSWRWENKNIL